MSDDHRCTILVVDNNPAVGRVLAAMVERHGFTARLAGSGDEGIAAFDDHRGEVAAVLLDVRMPGMDGPQTLAELRARDPGLPCVFVTGGVVPYSAPELAARGAFVLRKPVGVAELGRVLRAMSDKSYEPR